MREARFGAQATPTVQHPVKVTPDPTSASMRGVWIAGFPFTPTQFQRTWSPVMRTTFGACRAASARLDWKKAGLRRAGRSRRRSRVIALAKKLSYVGIRKENRRANVKSKTNTTGSTACTAIPSTGGAGNSACPTLLRFSRAVLRDTPRYTVSYEIHMKK